METLEGNVHYAFHLYPGPSLWPRQKNLETRSGRAPEPTGLAWTSHFCNSLLENAVSVQHSRILYALLGGPIYDATRRVIHTLRVCQGSPESHLQS